MILTLLLPKPWDYRRVAPRLVYEDWRWNLGLHARQELCPLSYTLASQLAVEVTSFRSHAVEQCSLPLALL